jgi:DNA-binding transcriptional LysR family regulator
VELHQLQCFIAVLEEGGFKRATARLGITQPALSYQIKRLEEELGVQLFHRLPGGITPTDSGRVLLEHAHHVISTVHEAHQAVRELSEGVAGEIRIGTIKCVGTYVLPRLLWEIRGKHPMVRPRLQYRSSEELLESVASKELDVALVADPAADRRLNYELAFEEQISLVAAPGHPLYGRPSVAISDLKDVQFVALSAQSSTGALIQRYIDRLGITIVPSFSTDDVETVKMMVEERMGVAFLPDMVTSSDVAGDGPRLTRTALEPPLSVRLFVITRRDSHRSLALDAFLDAVRGMGGKVAEAQPDVPPPPA